MSNTKLAVITTHPIQYNAPFFRLLAKENDFQTKVFYTWSQAKEVVNDKDFGQDIQWDIPLLDGYEYCFVENVSKKPGSYHRKGIVNPTLIQEVKSWGATHVLIYGWNLQSHLKVMKHFQGKIPVWFRGDSTLIDPQPVWKKMIRKIILTFVYRYVDVAFYVGQANKAYFLEYGLKENQLVQAPHAVDNIRFIDSSEKQYRQQAEAWRQRLGIPQNKPTILFAGKFENKKNPLFLIHAFTKANNTREQPAHLILLGNGHLEPVIKNLTKSDNNITILPFQNQSVMPVVYRLGDVFCLPSTSETWGLAINEAMACGIRPVMSNRVGCSFDITNHIDKKDIFEYNNIDQLVNIISAVTKQKSDDTKYSSFLNEFRYSNFIEKIKQLI